jgi:hypothetical protein
MSSGHALIVAVNQAIDKLLLKEKLISPVFITIKALNQLQIIKNTPSLIAVDGFQDLNVLLGDAANHGAAALLCKLLPARGSSLRSA